MTDRVLARSIVFRIVYIIYELSQTKGILLFPFLLDHPYRSLHGLGTLFGNDADTVIFPIVHVHHHIDRQVVSRNLHATGRRKDRRRIAEYIVRHIFTTALVSTFGLHIFPIATVIDLGKLTRIQRVDIMTAIEAQFMNDVLSHIVIESYARHLFQDGSGQVKAHIGVVVSFTRLVFEVRFHTITIDRRIQVVEREIILLVLDTGRMGKHHLQGDRNIRMMRIANLEANQVAHIIVQRNHPLVHQLQQRSSGKRLGDRGNSHDVIIAKRCLGFQVLVTDGLVIHNLTVLDYGSRNTYRLKLLENIRNGLSGLLFRERRTTGHP